MNMPLSPSPQEDRPPKVEEPLFKSHKFEVPGHIEADNLSEELRKPPTPEMLEAIAYLNGAMTPENCRLASTWALASTAAVLPEQKWWRLGVENIRQQAIQRVTRPILVKQVSHDDLEE